MTKKYYQAILQFSINPETLDIEVTSKFITEKGQPKKKKVVKKSPQQMLSQEAEEEYY